MAYCTVLIVYLHCILHLFASASYISSTRESKWRSTTQIQSQLSHRTPFNHHTASRHKHSMLLARLAMRPAVHLILFVVSAISVMADTEIRNFHLPLPPSTWSIHQTTQILDIPLLTSPHVLNITHTSPEIWIRTPLVGYKSWTARVSWPASVSHKR